MDPLDLAQLQIPESLSLSPDGHTVVFALKTVDLKRDRYISQLWRLTTDGSQAATKLTHGDSDTDPRLSPDQRWIAFRRAVDGEPAQLYLMPVDGGEPWAVTTREQHPAGAGSPVWSPDSTLLAYTARVPEPGRYGTDKERGPDKEAPRRITELRYRLDGVGYEIDRRTQVFALDPFAPEPAPRQLTSGDFDHNGIAWSPDGRLLAFAAARHDRRSSTVANDIFVIGVDGDGLRQLTDTRITCETPVFAADGSAVFFAAMELGENGLDWFARHHGAWVVALDGSNPARRLSDPDLYTLDGYFGRGRRGVLYTNQNRGAVELLEFSSEGGDPEVVIGGQRQVVAADCAGESVAAVVMDPASFGEIVVVDSGGERVLTSYGKQWAAYGMEELRTTAPDGHPVHGWLVRPEGPGPHPVLLMIHGGPFAQYGWRLFDEAQVYAGAGYAVVYGNPRGSSGYGHQHGRHIAGDVGARSAVDLLALLDHALADPGLDAARQGVLGGSHGGYMTSWLAAHTNRFKAAVSERAVNAIDSFLGTSDGGWAFATLYGSDPEQQRHQSPLTHAGKVETPMLIIHSENDYRCPMEQAQRYFHALKSRGKVVEMLLFPGEGHEMSRSGLPSHRVARFEAILEWFARHLGRD